MLLQSLMGGKGLQTNPPPPHPPSGRGLQVDPPGYYQRSPPFDGPWSQPCWGFFWVTSGHASVAKNYWPPYWTWDPTCGDWTLVQKHACYALWVLVTGRRNTESVSSFPELYFDTKIMRFLLFQLHKISCFNKASMAALDRIEYSLDFVFNRLQSSNRFF